MRDCTNTDSSGYIDPAHADTLRVELKADGNWFVYATCAHDRMTEQTYSLGHDDTTPIDDFAIALEIAELFAQDHAPHLAGSPVHVVRPRPVGQRRDHGRAMNAILLPQPREIVAGAGVWAVQPARIVQLDATAPTLDQMQALTHSRCVDVVTAALDGVEVDVWVDDEGMLTGRPQNLHASQLTRRPVIVGDALITQVNDNGDTVGLSDTALAALCAHFHITAPA